MGFVKNLAKGGLFGLSGLAATGAFDKKKPKPLQQSSLLTQAQTPSLVNRPTVY